MCMSDFPLTLYACRVPALSVQLTSRCAGLEQKMHNLFRHGHDAREKIREVGDTSHVHA
jgi:hypothetical protein